MTRLILAFLLLSIPASAQTLRDRSGNPLGHYSQEGNRTYFRDNDGNPHGYSTTLPNGTIEHRTNAGDLISRETPR